MKDYSEEIDLIVLELFGSAFAQGDMVMVTNKKATDKASTQIKSLFREIAKEATRITVEEDKYLTEAEGNKFLSNIEKVIK